MINAIVDVMVGAGAICALWLFVVWVNLWLRDVL